MTYGQKCLKVVPASSFYMLLFLSIVSKISRRDIKAPYKPTGRKTGKGYLIMSEIKNNEEGRLFTQEEVSRIVQDRLAREKGKRSEGETQREAELAKREAKVSCMEYVYSKGYNKDILELLDVSDFEAFKEKADKLDAMLTSEKSKETTVQGGTGSSGNFRRDHFLPKEETEDSKIRREMGLKKEP